MELIQKSVITYFIVSSLIFAAACLHWVSSISLAAILVLAALSALALRRWELDRSDGSSMDAAHKKALLVVSALIFIPLAHVLLLPPYVRDDVIYHLMVPEQLFEGGGFRFDPHNINSNFPMVFELPLTLIFLFKGWVPPQLVNYLVLISLCTAYVITARRILQINLPLALSAMVLVAATPVVYDQVRSCYVEIFMSLLLLLAFYNYYQFRRQRSQPMFWYLTMFFVGMLCATKYTGGVFALFILGVEFFAGRNRSQFYKGALICFAVCFPWYAKNWLLLGNPVFPLLGFLFPSEFVSIERSIFYSHLFADYHCGRSVIDYLLLPFRLLAGYDAEPVPGRLGFGGMLSFFYVCAYASLAALFKKNESDRLDGYMKVIGLLFVVYGIFWAITSQQVRFLLPVLILASLSGLSLVNTHWKRLKIPFFALAGLILLQNSVNIASVMEKEKIGALISGKMSREQFLNFHMPISFEMANKLNPMLDPQRHRLLAIGNFGRNYYYDVEVVTNTYYEAEILAQTFHAEQQKPEIFENFIINEKITHVLINHAYLNQFFTNNSSFDMNAMKRYLSRLAPILTQEAVTVYALKN